MNNSFDDLHIKSTDDCDIALNKSRFDGVTGENLKTKVSNYKTIVLNDKYPPLGIKGIRLNPDREELSFRIDSKILLGDYYQGINVDSIVRALTNICNTGTITFNVNKYLDNAVILSVDLCKNLKLHEPVKNYIPKLAIFSTKSGYHVNNIKSETLYVGSGVKSNTKNLRFYDKQKELCQYNALNRELWPHIDLDEYENVMRVEARVRTFANIRTYFKIPKGEDLKLMTILESKVPALKNYAVELTDYQAKVKALGKPAPPVKSLNDFIKNLGYEKLLDECNNDINIARAIVKSHCESTPTRDLSRLKEIHRAKICKEFEWDFDLVDEVINQL